MTSKMETHDGVIEKSTLSKINVKQKTLSKDKLDEGYASMKDLLKIDTGIGENNTIKQVCLKQSGAIHLRLCTFIL